MLINNPLRQPRLYFFDAPADQGSSTPPAPSQAAPPPPTDVAAPAPQPVAPVKVHRINSDLMSDLKAKTNSLKGTDPSVPTGDEPPVVRKEAPAPPSDKTSPGDAITYADGFGTEGVEIEGIKYFYHPEHHGKETGQANTFKTRESAEHAIVAKVEKVSELVSKLQELGAGVGPFELPEWLGDGTDIEAIADRADIEQVLSMPDEELRTFIKEADTLITRLGSREKRVTERTERKTQLTALERDKSVLQDRLLAAAEDLGLTELLATKPDLESFKQKMQEQTKAKIEQDVKSVREEYERYKKDEDARLDDPKYADKLLEKYEALKEKVTERETHYQGSYFKLLDEIKEFDERASELEGTSNEVTEEQRLRSINDAFMGLQEEMAALPEAHRHPMFLSGDPNAPKAFQRWALNRAEEFNGLQTEQAWGKALRRYDTYISEKRAEIQQKKRVEAAQRQQTSQQRMPGYGDQTLLTNQGSSQYKANSEEINALKARTNALHTNH